MDASKPPSHYFKILFGLTLFIILLFIPTPHGLSTAAWHTVAIIILMISWWASEAIPIAATALAPLVLFPIFAITPIAKLASSYGNPIIFLFLGGFIIALAMQKTGLHRRIALYILHSVGTKPQHIVLGFIICTALLSMWISNTATTIMMLPIAESIAEIEVNNNGHVNPIFATALMLSIAYSASIGGISTLIGTPPNAFLSAYLQQTLNHNLDFSLWMSHALPLAIILLVLLFIIMTKFIFKFDAHPRPCNKSYILSEIEKLGRFKKSEKYVAAIFMLTVGLWLTNRWLGSIIPDINNSSVAIFGGLLLFFVPGDDHKPLLTFSTFGKLPWDILLLFGGGLSIALAINSTGLNDYLASYLNFIKDVPIIIMIFIICFAMVFITEVMSNTAAIATFLPIITILANAAHIDPLRLLIPATFSVSCAFMLPIATPPNAIVYASRRIKITQMIRAGFILNVIFSIIISLYGYIL